MTNRYTTDDVNEKKQQLDGWIEAFIRTGGKSQLWDDLRELIYKVEQIYTDEKGVISKEGIKKIKQLKKGYACTKERTELIMHKRVQSGELKKTHFDLLVELGMDKSNIEELYESQPQVWKKKYCITDWRWKCWNPKEEEWEICSWKKPETPKLPTFVDAWMKADSQTDIGRKFNWNEKEVGTSETKVNNTLREMGLDDLPTLPKFNNAEKREQRLMRLGDVPKDVKKRDELTERLRNILMKKGGKVLGSTSK